MRHQHPFQADDDSVFLDDALRRAFADEWLVKRADDALARAVHDEPLIAQSLRTPQSLPHHAEGPFLEDHLRAMLTGLFAIADGSVRLARIEELRRWKDEREDVEEWETLLRERIGLFQAFILCHDAAKWASVSCEAAPGGSGVPDACRLPVSAHWTDEGIALRARARQAYAEAYAAFAAQRRGLPPAEVQAAFWEHARLRVHYPGHDRLIHTPVYQALLRRVCRRLGVTEREADLLEDVIAMHLQPLRDFDAVHPARMERYLAVAKRRGHDAEEFLDVLQAANFLDYTVGSAQRAGAAAHPRRDASVVIRFLQSEYAHQPGKREAKRREREERRKRERNRLYREAGLDGVSLMELLDMPPGPAFGTTLAAIHAAAEGQGPLPAFPPRITAELQRRLKLLAL